MAKTFTLNGKRYPVKILTFDDICDLEDAGMSIDDIQRRPMSFLREYLAMCLGVDRHQAAAELGKHIAGGGKLDPVFNAMKEAMNRSDFFRALDEMAETEAPEAETEAEE